MALVCSLSGKVPDVPVISKYGHIFEKTLIEKFLEANGNTCPVTQQPLSKEDLTAVQASKIVPPRPITATSIPAMLTHFQNEWDAVMLETYSLKHQLETVRQELAHALYQHDAACRVIARLMKERDEARAALAQYQANPSAAPKAAPAASESMEIESGLSDQIKQKLDSTSKELAQERKKRKPSEQLATAEDIKEYDMKQTNTLHSTTTPGITTVDIHPTEQKNVLTGGMDGSLILFNSSTKKIVGTFSEHNKRVNEVFFHPTKQLLLSCSADKTAKVWGLSGKNSYKSVHTVKHQGDVVGCSLHATGDYWATASADKTWSFHDIEAAKTVATVAADTAFSTISFHPDGLILGTGSADSAVKIWDVKTQKNAATFEGHKGKVVDLNFSENGYYLATASEDNTVKLWDLRKLKSIQSISLPDDFHLSAIDFDYSGTYLAVAGADVRVYIGKTFNHVATFSKHTQVVNDVKWGNDAKFLVSVSLDRTLKTWATA